MFENILYQSAISQISTDILNNNFPHSVLFSGVKNCAKLTTALEVARALSCKKTAQWSCDCDSCQKNRILSNPNLLLLGYKDMTREIKASAATFIESFNSVLKQKMAAKMLFIRSVRKLTSRFNGALYSDSPNLTKISSLAADIEELLHIIEVFDGVDSEDAERALTKLQPLCESLQVFLPRSTPIDHIRGLETFARLKSDQYKFIIIESCHSMTDSARNALLKILEEPPERCIFIMTCDKKSALLPTILSRLRVYNFSERTLAQDSEICERVFHKGFSGSLTQFFVTYSPVDNSVIQNAARQFFDGCNGGELSISTILKSCASFSDAQTLDLFFNALIALFRPLLTDGPKSVLKARAVFNAIQRANTNILTYNEQPQAALEILLQSIRGL